MKQTSVIAAAVIAGLAWHASAQEPADAPLAQARANEQRVRDSLRATTQQLRAAEAEKATLQAGQAERDQKITALETQLASITAQASKAREEATQTVSTLTADLQRKSQEVAKLQASLEKWKASHSQATSLIRKGEAARARLESENIILDRTIRERERQNLELYKTGTEILQRYADFSLGRALAAREPFTGLARARLEEQLQGYADQLQDAKLKPAPSDGHPSTTPAPTPASSRISNPTPPSSTKTRP